jgi:hypothetical protein
MKKLLTILMLIFTCIFVKAQKETVAGELSIWVYNNPQNKNISLTLELVSPACWDENHYITELFNGGTVSGTSNWLEFLVCWETFPEEYYRTFGLGLYKITAKVNGVVKDHFFIDYRTSDLPGAIGLGCQIDYLLDFNVGTEKFYYRGTQDEFSDYHAFWDLRPCVDLITDGLEDHWENALAVVYRKNSGVNEPFLAWGPYNDFQPTGYKIYWRLGGSGNFSLLATVDANTFTYQHNGLAVGSGLLAEYKVQAYNNQSTSDFTNIASITTSGFYKENSRGIESGYVSDYQLYQNYPNPFNPSTVISYQTPSDNFVTLKVFDVLGREVAELVNTYKEAGTHSVEFNGSELSSGMYLYRIQIGSYVETRKLILQK